MSDDDPLTYVQKKIRRLAYRTEALRPDKEYFPGEFEAGLKNALERVFYLTKTPQYAALQAQHAARFNEELHAIQEMLEKRLHSLPPKTINVIHVETGVRHAVPLYTNGVVLYMAVAVAFRVPPMSFVLRHADVDSTLPFDGMLERDVMKSLQHSPTLLMVDRKPTGMTAAGAGSAGRAVRVADAADARSGSLPVFRTDASSSERCKCMTKKKTQCSFKAKEGGYCHLHAIRYPCKTPFNDTPRSNSRST